MREGLTGHYARPDIASLLVNLKPYRVMRTLEPRVTDVSSELPFTARVEALNRVLEKVQSLQSVIEATENGQLLPLIDSVRNEIQKLIESEV
ncbi:hypothetical protein BSNK01_01180 [Bacillaceae bacterium]